MYAQPDNATECKTFEFSFCVCVVAVRDRQKQRERQVLPCPCVGLVNSDVNAKRRIGLNSLIPLACILSASVGQELKCRRREKKTVIQRLNPKTQIILADKIVLISNMVLQYCDIFQCTLRNKVSKLYFSVLDCSYQRIIFCTFTLLYFAMLLPRKMHMGVALIRFYSKGLKVHQWSKDQLQTYNLMYLGRSILRV